MRDRKATQSPASVLVAVFLGNRVLFDRIKFALEFDDHQLEPLAHCGIDHHGGEAFCAGKLGKEHVDVRHGFHKCGALAPRNRSTNQNVQIATRERTKIPPACKEIITSSVVLAYRCQLIGGTLMNRIIIQGAMSHASGAEITKLLTTTAGSKLLKAGALPNSPQTKGSHRQCGD